MFRGCDNLAKAPELPATNLAESCYNGMFWTCRSIANAPKLPATTLAGACYADMFYGCTSLTTAPKLPATTFVYRCYSRMFHGCTSIKISETQLDEYSNEYRIPTSGTGATAEDALADMFTNTGGTFDGTPEINKTYYTSNTVV